MTAFAWVLAAAAVAATIVLVLLVSRDARRLRSGRIFRESREPVPRGSFLSLYSEEELERLEAPRLRWISSSLPDPRVEDVSVVHAQYYWRIALHRFETSQMIAELAITVLSAVLGAILGVLASLLLTGSLQLSDLSNYLLLAIGLIVLALAAAVSTKIAAGRRWSEAIALYARIGWPDDEPRPRSFWSLFRRLRR